MFVFLSKLLPPLIYPLGLACLFILLALLLRRRAGWQRAALLLALLALVIGGNRWVAMGLARSLERRYLPSGPMPQAEAIVVLGGGTESRQPPRPITQVNGAGDRVLYAAWLYQQAKAPAILVSGGLLDWTPGHTTPAQDMAALLEMIGVPSQAIWLQPESRNTYEDALYSAQILKDKGIRRILLVTSAWHMPRSVGLFEAQGLQVLPAPTDFYVTDADWNDLTRLDLRAQMLRLLPSADNLALTTRMLKEYLGMWIYNLQGYYENQD
jgi:uncharacterized SAM-binding protein YcdF (DUF218 family)